VSSVIAFGGRLPCLTSLRTARGSTSTPPSPCAWKCWCFAGGPVILTASVAGASQRRHSPRARRKDSHRPRRNTACSKTSCPAFGEPARMKSGPIQRIRTRDPAYTACIAWARARASAQRSLRPNQRQQLRLPDPGRQLLARSGDSPEGREPSLDGPAGMSAPAPLTSAGALAVPAIQRGNPDA
jgi:hypothetical protein